MKPSEVALTIWEVDDDADGVIDWEEFKTLFFRARDDETGYEPRKMFMVIEFLMFDKNLNGSMDVDECLAHLNQRFGKDAVDTAFGKIRDRPADAKTVNFTTFLTMQMSADKIVKQAGLPDVGRLKEGQVRIPGVKELQVTQDPNLSHLL